MDQVHKETLTTVEDALPNRADPNNVEIFGMEGIPEDIMFAHRQRIAQAFQEAEQQRMASSGHGGQNNNAPGSKKAKLTESKEDLKARLAAHKAQKQLEREAKANGTWIEPEAVAKSDGASTPAAADSPAPIVSVLMLHYLRTYADHKQAMSENSPHVHAVPPMSYGQQPGMPFNQFPPQYAGQAMDITRGAQPTPPQGSFYPLPTVGGPPPGMYGNGGPPPNAYAPYAPPPMPVHGSEPGYAMGPPPGAGSPFQPLPGMMPMPPNAGFGAPSPPPGAYGASSPGPVGGFGPPAPFGGVGAHAGPPAGYGAPPQRNFTPRAPSQGLTLAPGLPQRPAEVPRISQFEIKQMHQGGNFTTSYVSTAPGVKPAVRNEHDNTASLQSPVLGDGSHIMSANGDAQKPSEHDIDELIAQGMASAAQQDAAKASIPTDTVPQHEPIAPPPAAAPVVAPPKTAKKQKEKDKQRLVYIDNEVSPEEKRSKLTKYAFDPTEMSQAEAQASTGMEV